MKDTSTSLTFPTDHLGYSFRKLEIQKLKFDIANSKIIALNWS